MLVPFIDLVTQRPDLILDHVLGYVKLVQDEANGARQRFIRRLVAAAVALVFAVVFLVLLGVAFMLMSFASAQPQFQAVNVVTLFSVPALVLLATVVAAFIAIKGTSRDPGASLAQYIQRDLQAFREVLNTRAPKHE